MGHQGETTFKRIAWVLQRQLAFTIGEPGKDAAEMAIHCAEGLHKGLLTQGGHRFNAQQQLLALIAEHLEPLAQLSQTGFQLLELLERQHVHRLQRFHALLNHAQLLLQRLQAGFPQLIADLRQGVGQFSHLLLQALSQGAALFGEGLDLLGQALQFPLPLLLLLTQSR